MVTVQLICLSAGDCLGGFLAHREDRRGKTVMSSGFWVAWMFSRKWRRWASHWDDLESSFETAFLQKWLSFIKQADMFICISLNACTPMHVYDVISMYVSFCIYQLSPSPPSSPPPSTDSTWPEPHSKGLRGRTWGGFAEDEAIWLLHAAHECSPSHRVSVGLLVCWLVTWLLLWLLRMVCLVGFIWFYASCAEVLLEPPKNSTMICGDASALVAPPFAETSVWWSNIPTTVVRTSSKKGPLFISSFLTGSAIIYGCGSLQAFSFHYYSVLHQPFSTFHQLIFLNCFSYLT